MPQGVAWITRLSHATSQSWVRTLAILWGAQVISELAFSFALPFIPLYIQELGVESVTEAGIWAGAMSGGFAVVMGLMGPVWGMVADRYGRRLMIQRALFGACLVIGAMSLVQSPEQLLVLQFVQGALTGVVAATTTVVSLTVPRQHLASSLGLMHAAMFVGASLGPILGGVFSDAFGFRAAFAVTGGFFLFAGILVTLFVPEPAREPSEREHRQESFAESVRQVVARRELIAVIGMMAVVRFANMAPQPVIPLFVQALVVDRERLATITGSVVAATGIASTISALVIGRLADRYGRRQTLFTCLIAATALSVPHIFVSSVWQLLVLRTAMGFALGGMLPAIQALLTELTPSSRRGMAFGVLATASAFGNGGGPMLGSLVAAAFGMPSVFVGVIPIFGVGVWLLTRLAPQGASESAHDVVACGARR